MVGRGDGESCDESCWWEREARRDCMVVSEKGGGRCCDGVPILLVA